MWNTLAKVADVASTRRIPDGMDSQLAQCRFFLLFFASFPYLYSIWLSPESPHSLPPKHSFYRYGLGRPYLFIPLRQALPILLIDYKALPLAYCFITAPLVQIRCGSLPSV